MRMYGERFLNRKIRAEVQSKTETRDAVVVDIDYAKSTCRVKIQGSNEYIAAYFSELRSMSPAWLKPGAAVRIAHKGGIRGYVDVVGAGQTVPTGVGAMPKQQAPAADAVLSGCSLMLPTASRDAFGQGTGILWVTTGNYRVNNTVRPLPCLKMAKTKPLKMQNRPVIGQIAAQFILTRPGAGNYLAGRVLLNKANGEISCPTVIGTSPTTPTCPDTCLDLGCFLYSYLDEEFSEACLNNEFQKPVPLYFSISGSIVVKYGTDRVPISVEVRDQYGKPIANTPGWSLSVTLASGTGSVSGDGVTAGKSIHALFEGLHYTFYYYRDKSVEEKPPTIKISISEVIGVQEHKLFLLDEAGQLIE